MKSTQRPRIVQPLLLGAACSCAMASVLFGFLYYNVYWQYRGLFNEKGRYFDEGHLVVYHEQGALLIVPTCAFALLAVLFLALWWIRRRSMVARGAGGS